MRPTPSGSTGWSGWARKPRQKAQEKLAKFTAKIGYPDKWRDYSVAGDRARRSTRQHPAWRAFEYKRQMDKLGKPVDRDRVVHDPADGQRLLQSEHERNRLPGRDPAAAVLRR